MNGNGKGGARGAVQAMYVRGGMAQIGYARARIDELDRALDRGNAFRALRAISEAQYELSRLAMHLMTAVESEAATRTDVH